MILKLNPALERCIEDYERMNNELRILPLRRYDVTFYDAVVGEATDVFTADHYEVKDGRTIFRRTGNTVREYQTPLTKIVVTPIDDDTQVPE